MVGLADQDADMLVFVRLVNRSWGRLRRIVGNDAMKLITAIEKFISGKGSTELLSNLGLGSKINITEWLYKLLDYDRGKIKLLEEYLRYLLNDFTDYMKTRMKAEEKCAIGFVWKDHVFLAHTRCGSAAVSSDLKVIEKLIDESIIYRFVYFRNHKGKITVKFYERTRSESFREWLGLVKEDYNYYDYHGQVKLIGMAHGSEIEIRFPGEKYLDIIEGKDESFHIDPVKGELHFRKPLSTLKIIRSKIGRKELKDIRELQKIFIIGEVFKIKEVLDIISRIQSLKNFYPNNIVVSDYPHEVIVGIKVKENNIIQEIPKRTNNGSYLIFADGENIVLAEEFIHKLALRFINGEKTKVMFIPIDAVKEKKLLFKIISYEPTIVGTFEIYNRLSFSKNLYKLIKYYNSSTTLPREIRVLLGFIILHLIAKELQTVSGDRLSEQASYVFSRLSAEIMERAVMVLSDRYKITITEDLFFELKSADYVVGRDKEIVERLANDLKKKLLESQLKIYVIGVNERNREIEPISRSKFKDERIENIRKGIIQELKKEYPHVAIELFPIELGDSKIILLMIARVNVSPTTTTQVKVSLTSSQ